ncbi:EamA family transporter RarD [Pseudomonas peli]|uniref:EamA family transporter RarD n=1 Tax=Pseudomonas peli TaxID=592361 RepID=UPI003D1557A9
MLHARRQPAPRGTFLGLSAYIIWGLFPLYFKAIASVPPWKSSSTGCSGRRCSARCCYWSGNTPAGGANCATTRRLAILALSGTLIAGNWLTYVWSVNNGRMLEASLGYYINPLINVLLGMLILGERLRRLQWLAVGWPAVGVAQQVWQVGSLPWVSLVLALTFGFYGLIRKQAPVRPCRRWWWKPGCWCRWRLAGCCCTRRPSAPRARSGPAARPGGWWRPAR